MERKYILIGAAGVTGLAALLIWQRRRVYLVGATVFDAAKKAIFLRIIPSRSARYGEAILRVAAEENVSPFLIVALMERESRSGEALAPPNPSGTGDSGHGRGLMQIDDRSWGDWLRSNNWADPYTNIKQGVKILKGKMKFFQLKSDKPVRLTGASAQRRGVPDGSYFTDPRPLSGNRLLEAAIAAYNTGEGNVLANLAAGKSADYTTANANYSSDVLARVASWTSSFNSAA